MHTDPIADLLTRIRNAYNAHHQALTISHSNMKENILKIMKDHKFIEDYSSEGEGSCKVLNIDLKEELKDITFKRISKPGQRIYIKKSDLKPVKSGLGISIVSTPKGIMTNSEARKQNLGGELLCEIY
ncbi:MAG: 30S ribosomal protein S8 [Patescibacteria group bacterium]